MKLFNIFEIFVYLRPKLYNLFAFKCMSNRRPIIAYLLYLKLYYNFLYTLLHFLMAPIYI